MKNRGSVSFFGRWVRPLLIGTAVGVLVCTVTLMLMALVVRAVDVPEGALRPMAVAAGGIGAFFAGIGAAISARQKGWLIGALCGVMLFLLILLAGICRRAEIGAGFALIKAAVLITVGSLGGICGVNIRRR